MSVFFGKPNSRRLSVRTPADPLNPQIRYITNDTLLIVPSIHQPRAISADLGSFYLDYVGISDTSETAKFLLYLYSAPWVLCHEPHPEFNQ